MVSPNAPLITWLIVIPLIGWRLVVRYRRLTQRQKLSRVRPWITLTLFPLLLWLLAMTAFVPPGPPQPWKLSWLAGALLVGAGLSIYGLKRTRFEDAGSDGVYYTPDARLGIAITVLFVARLVWRLGEHAVHGTAAAGGPQFVLDPWTLVPLGVFSGYYMGYAAGLLAWASRRRRRLRTNA